MATQREHVGDLVVVVPGILGSRLADAEGREVWGLSGRALLRGIRTFGKSVTGLTLPADIGDGHPGDGVRPAGLMPDLHALPGVGPLVDGYSGLVGWLEQYFTLRRRMLGDEPSTPANLIEFAYDWRLSCRYNAARLAERVDEELGRWRASAPERAHAKAVFVCHSMGGLVTRQYVEQGGGAEVTRRVITLGTPYRGSLDALLSLVNGLRPGFGPVRLDLTRFARSLPSLHQLTPDYACLRGVPDHTELRYAREVPGLPGVDEALLKDAALFHEALRESLTGAAYGVKFTPVGGALQPTPTTADLDGEGALTGLFTIDGADEGGDGRVPRLSSAHVGSGGAAYTPWEQHGSLQNNTGVRWALWGWLAGATPVHRGPAEEAGAAPLGVGVPEAVVEGEACEVTVTVPEQVPGYDELAVAVSVEGAGPERTMRNLGGGLYVTVLDGLPAGAHRVRVSARGAGDAAVTALVLVAERERDA